MKIKSSIFAIAACATVVTFSGCNKHSETATGGAGSAATATDAAKDMAGKVADTAKDVASQAMGAASNTVSAVTGPFADGIANAKKAIADKDYQGALGELNKLSSLNLSDEQTKVVDGLKADVQGMLSKATGSAGGAVDAAKGLLGK